MDMYNNFYQNSIHIINTITENSQKFLNNEDACYLYYSSFYMYFAKKISLQQYSDIFIDNFYERLSTSEGTLCKFVMIYIEQMYGITVQNINLYKDSVIFKLAYNEFKTNKILFFNTYIDYYIQIFEDLNISKYPIIIDIQTSNKYHIVEGIHRFILCYLKLVEPTTVVAKSYYEPYNNILTKLVKDYDTMYKKSNKCFILYNKIPHMLFNNYKSIREDRSSVIIDFLKDKNVLTGLDIGTQNGLLSFQLQKQNYNMTAIEYNMEYYELTNNISKLMDIPINLIYTNVYDYQITMLQFDFIVSLSVFYHLKRNNKTQFDILFINLMKNTKILIFDDEPNTQLLCVDYINELLINNNITHTIHKLYVGRDNRAIYAILNEENFAS
jgi:hypothetical protein